MKTLPSASWTCWRQHYNSFFKVVFNCLFFTCLSLSLCLSSLYLHCNTFSLPQALCVSFHRFPSHQPLHLPPPPPFTFTPLISHVVILHPTQPSIALSAVKSKHGDMGYLTHHWSCWSAPSKVLLAVRKRLIFTQTHARTNLHVWLIGSWLMLSERFTVCVACLNTNTSNKYFNYCNIFAPFLYFFSLLHHKTG